MSSMFRSFVAGQLATLREFTLYAPTINPWRFADSSFAPTAAGTIAPAPCGWLATGKNTSGRMPGSGGDVNQYWRWRLIAGGVRYRAGPGCPSPVSQRLPRRR